MENTQYFLFINNIDLHARSAKNQLSCKCNFVVRYNNIQCVNANFAHNGDHINSAVVHTKDSKSIISGTDSGKSKSACDPLRYT